MIEIDMFIKKTHSLFVNMEGHVIPVVEIFDRHTFIGHVGCLSDPVPSVVLKRDATHAC